MESEPIAIAALAVSAIVGVLLTGFTLIFLCLWCKTRKELLILKRRVYYKPKPEPVQPMSPVQPVPPVQLPPPLGVVEQPQSPPTTPPPEEETPPSPIHTRSKGVSPNYHAVNNIAILPDEVRTPANLEAGQLSEEKGQQMMEDYLRKRAQYEQNQLAKAQSAAGEIITPGYEVVSPARDPQFPPVKQDKPGDYENTGLSKAADQSSPGDKGKPDPRIGAYNNPADYLPPDHSLMEALKPSTAPSQKKQVQVSTSADQYTEVFDSLLSSGELTASVKVRAMSESKPRGRPSAGGVTSPTAGSVGNVDGFGERIDATRSKRDSVKEIVELDFGNKKKFRVAAKKDKEVAEDGGEDSYALVNLADKQRYRAESDSHKNEGSGTPLHYKPGAVVMAT